MTQSFKYLCVQILACVDRNVAILLLYEVEWLRVKRETLREFVCVKMKVSNVCVCVCVCVCVFDEMCKEDTSCVWWDKMCKEDTSFNALWQALLHAIIACTHFKEMLEL
jgi:hypothetical protein